MFHMSLCPEISQSKLCGGDFDSSKLIKQEYVTVFF